MQLTFCNFKITEFVSTSKTCGLLDEDNHSLRYEQDHALASATSLMFPPEYCQSVPFVMILKFSDSTLDVIMPYGLHAWYYSTWRPP